LKSTDFTQFSQAASWEIDGTFPALGALGLLALFALLFK
jgi:hypothetical protein